MDSDDFWALKMIVFFVTFFVLIVEAGGRWHCHSYEKNTGKKTEWALLNACYVNYNDEIMTMKEYRQIIVAREGLKN